MAYIGAEPVPGQNREVDDISSSFNGSTTAFTLQVSGVNVSPESANNILVNLGGVLQNPGTDYTIAASTITFTTAPAAGLSFFALVLGAGINTATVADDTIGASKLIDTAVTAGSYTTADITVDAQGRITAAANGTISGAEIADQAVTNAKINNSAAIAVSKLANFVTNNADNRVITGSGTTNTLNGEANLTFSSSLLVSDGNGSVNVGGNYILLKRTSGNANYVNAPLADGDLILSADENLLFHTVHTADFNSTERMRIDSSGRLLIGKTSTSLTHPLQVQSDSNANGIVVYGRSSDDISEISYYENDGSTKLGELQYRQDHVAFRHRVGHIEFATTYSGNSVSERMRLFQDQLCIGLTAGSGLGASRRLQVRGTTHSNNGINILSTHNDDNPAVIDIGKSRSSGNAILGNNDDVGQINFYGNDGSGFHSMARILCRCQGHDTSNDDLPAALVFSTLTENTTALKERLIIDDEGIHSICSQNHALGVSTTASSGTNKYNFRGHHSGTNGQPGSGTLSFTVWSNGNVENLNNSYGSTSDIKLKENIVDANSQWNDIKAIKIRNYNFKEETGQSTKTQIGLVAQELETVCPKLVYETPDFDDKGEDLGTTTKCISYSVLYMKAIKALQEAITKIETLETKVAALEAA